MSQRIFGINFFRGSLHDLLSGVPTLGLVVVPSAPVIVDMQESPELRKALQAADCAIADSGLMVLIWRLATGQRLNRISGLKLVRALLDNPDTLTSHPFFWVMPSESQSRCNLTWLKSKNISVPASHCYIAPRYDAGPLEDAYLLSILEKETPAIIILCLGGGTQERLGYYLKTKLSYNPTIFCTGAAIAFLSGVQATIPPLFDYLMLGWALRIARNPKTFFPRYIRALKAIPLVYSEGRKSRSKHSYKL